MTEPELTVLREDGATRGRYVIHLAPGYEAEMTFRKAADGTITIPWGKLDAIKAETQDEVRYGY